MKLRFVRLVALRYFQARSRSRGVASTVVSVLGLTVGVMTLTAVLAVMNGFQLGFVESILEISSYHLQLRPRQRPLRVEEWEAVLRLKGVKSLVPFTEYQAIATPASTAGGEAARRANQRGCLIRGLPGNVAELDPAFIDHLDMVAGIFFLDAPDTIVLGVELARHLGISIGDKVSLLGLTGSSFNLLRPVARQMVVTGLFRSGYYEYDLGWGFVSLETAAANFGSGAADPEGADGHVADGHDAADPEFDAGSLPTYGIKISNRFRDQGILRQIREALPGQGLKLESWRGFNRAFFNALLMEKLVMMAIIGLIFVVVGFNIYHSLRRTVRERYEEIGILKALGAGSGDIQYVFITEGLLIGLLGSALGVLLGMGIAANINTVLAFIETVFNGILFLVGGLLDPLIRARGERFSFFSPAYFYISQVPSRVLFHETLLIALFALLSTVIAAATASRRVMAVKPAEILRYE